MISAKPWSIEAVLRLFLWVITSLFVGTLVAGLLEEKSLGLGEDRRQFLQTIVMLSFFQGAALIWIAVFLSESNISWRSAFGLRPPSRVRAIGAGLAVGILVLPVTWFLQMMSQFVMVRLDLAPSTQAAVEVLQKPSLSVADKALLGSLAILLVPAAEEALFRGILYPTIKQAGHPRWALWGTSVVFGLMHMNMASMVSLVFLAVVLAFLYESSGSLLTPIAAHSMFNAANFFYLMFADQINRVLHIS